MKRSMSDKWLVGKMNLWKGRGGGGGGSYVPRMNFKTYCYNNFTQLDKDCHWLIVDCDTFEQLYPARDAFQHVINAWWKVA